MQKFGFLQKLINSKLLKENEKELKGVFIIGKNYKHEFRSKIEC